MLTVIETPLFQKQWPLYWTDAELEAFEANRDLAADLLTAIDGKKLVRKPVIGEMDLKTHADRILCMGSLAEEERSYQLSVVSRS